MRAEDPGAASGLTATTPGRGERVLPPPGLSPVLPPSELPEDRGDEDNDNEQDRDSEIFHDARSAQNSRQNGTENGDLAETASTRTTATDKLWPSSNGAGDTTEEDGAAVTGGRFANGGFGETSSEYRLEGALEGQRTGPDAKAASVGGAATSATARVAPADEASPSRMLGGGREGVRRRGAGGRDKQKSSLVMFPALVCRLVRFLLVFVKAFYSMFCCYHYGRSWLAAAIRETPTQSSFLDLVCWRLNYTGSCIALFFSWRGTFLSLTAVRESHASR